MYRRIDAKYWEDCEDMTPHIVECEYTWNREKVEK